jgi:CheY-like chemotaxis protein
VPIHRILIVDDSAAARRSIEAALEPLGLDVEGVENGAVALKRLEAAPADVVFLDLQMPVLDGPGLLRVLQQRRNPARVVLVTSSSDRKAIGSAVHLGAVDFVSKPFDAADVRAALARALGVEPGALVPEAPRVLAVEMAPDAAAALAAALPAHALLDAVPAESAEGHARRHGYRLVLVDASIGGAADLGSRLAVLQPEAARFRVEPGAPEAQRCVAHGSYDGTLPSPLPGALVRGVLVPCALRPLAAADAARIAVAAHRGAAEDLPLYFAVAARRLRAALSVAAQDAGSIVADLSRAPAEPARIVALAAALRAEAEPLGVDLAFVAPPPAREALAAAGAALAAG